MRSKLSLRMLAATAFVSAALSALADGYPDVPGIYPNRDYIHQSFAEHIDPFNGNLQLHYVDGFAPGNGGFDLKIQRSYNVLNVLRTNEAYSPFGRGWNIHFGRVVLSGASCTNSTALTFELPDGNQQTFYKSTGVGGTSTSDFISTSFWKGTCDASGVLKLFAPDGTRYDMTEIDTGSSLASKITDRNGNYASITYFAITQWGKKAPSSITTSDGRSASFSYSGGRLTTITVQGRSWSYTISSAADGSNVLTSVQPPTGSAWTYTYFGNQGTAAGSYALQSVRNPQGGVISYTYLFVNFIPGLIGVNPTAAVVSKNSSLGNWTFSYSPSTSSGVYDTTTVTMPGSLGSITYKHFGYNTIIAGEVWMIGLLYQKTTGSTQTETLAWSPQTISSHGQSRPGYFKLDTVTSRPLLASRTVTRDGATFSTTYSGFDSFGNPGNIGETGSASRTRTLTYFNSVSNWIVGFPNNETTSGAGSITRSLDSNGNMTSESRFGVQTTFGYLGTGDISSKTDARGDQTTYSGYTFGIPGSEFRPVGVVITRSKDNYGNVVSETDGESTWGFGYDGLNRVTSVTHPAGSGTSIAWADTSRGLTRGAYTETTQFDSFGRVTSLTRVGVQQTFTYDALGRKTFESLPGSAAGTTFSYDILGRVTSAISPAGTRSTSYSGYIVTVINERGKATSYTYARYGDPDEGFLTYLNSPASTAISMTRDTVGTLLSATQNSIVRNYVRDSHLFVTSIVEPETGTTTLGRDAVGNMISKSVGGVSTNYSYDGLNRLSTISYGGTAGTVNLTYDRRGKVTRVTNPAATRDYLYDANGNLSEDKLTIDGQVFVVDYTYDSIDGLSTINYPMSKGLVTYTPDAFGRPTRVSPYATGVTHYGSGNLSSVTFLNGTSMSYGENNRQLPSSITASSIQIGLSYSYDNDGNVSSITDSYVPTASRTLAYDDADRLTSATGPWVGGTGGSFSYTGDGNLLSQQLGSYQINYAYSSNRVSTISGSRTMSFSYDGRGNVTNNGRIAFGYDTASQLSCAKCGAGDEIDYLYDGQGRRVSERKGGNTTYFVQAPNGDLQFEYTPYGKVWVKHAHLNGKRVASETDSDAAVTVTTLGASPSTTVFGSTVVFTASISQSPTGTVEFREGAQLLGSGVVSSGFATLSVSTFSVGTHSIVANYLGDANNQASASSATSVVVNKRSATTALLASPSSGPLGNTATLSATVTGSGPTGQVTFNEGATALGTVSLSNGVASLTTAALSGGTHSFTATYGGDQNHLSSLSNTATTSISKAAPSVTLTTSNPNSNVGSLVTFTATISGNASFVPSGAVTFLDGTTALGAVTLARGSASIGTTTLSAGTHSITAAYAGDANYASSSSSAVAQHVTAASSTSLTASGQRLKQGQPVTLTATVSGYTPTGLVHFLDNGTEIASASVVSGIASVRIPLTQGLHVLSAVYDGDPNNAASTSAGVSRTVVFDPGITTLNPELMD